MSYVNIWSVIRDARDYKNLNKRDQDELLKKVFNRDYMHSYNFLYLVSILAPQLDSKTLLKLVKEIFDYSGIRKTAYVMDILLHSIKRPELTEDIRNLVKNKSDKSLQKILLWLKDPSEKEEELGLRSLSTSKYAPDFVFSRRFKPRKSVMEKIPPVMKLNIIEVLTNSFDLGYNILENFKDPDEFKRLLFGSVIRHRDRVERVIKRYTELSDFGKPKVFDVNIKCKNCGDINVTVTTGKIKNNDRLFQTPLGRVFNKYWCPVCRGYEIQSDIVWR